jgi:hypothetical protein
MHITEYGVMLPGTRRNRFSYAPKGQTLFLEFKVNALPPFLSLIPLPSSGHLKGVYSHDSPNHYKTGNLRLILETSKIHVFLQSLK